MIQPAQQRGTTVCQSVDQGGLPQRAGSVNPPLRQVGPLRGGCRCWRDAERSPCVSETRGRSQDRVPSVAERDPVTARPAAGTWAKSGCAARSGRPTRSNPVTCPAITSVTIVDPAGVALEGPNEGVAVAKKSAMSPCVGRDGHVDGQEVGNGVCGRPVAVSTVRARSLTRALCAEPCRPSRHRAHDPFSAAAAAITTTPVSMPAIGPNRMAAEMVALAATQCGRPGVVAEHPLVGRDDLGGQHQRHDHHDFASTQAGRRPNPCR